MQCIKGFEALPQIEHPVATIGSYDGVHAGHKLLIEHTIARAAARNGKSVVITFEPHPRITLGQDEGLRLITTLEEKILILEQMGVDFLIVIPFDKQFSELSNEQFVEHYLIEKLQVEEIIIGYNHHFGHNKAGDYSFLASRYPQIAVTRIEQHRVSESKLSSTTIRSTIEQGDLKSATQLLAHPYIIIGDADASGIVTLNPYKLLPPNGIYSAIVNHKKQEIEIINGAINCGLYSTKVTIEL